MSARIDSADGMPSGMGSLLFARTLLEARGVDETAVANRHPTAHA